MWVVVTVHHDPIRGTSVEVLGPWEHEACQRERRRRLADHAHQNSHCSNFSAHVAPVRNEVVAP